MTLSMPFFSTVRMPFVVSLLGFHPEALRMQVRQEAAALLVIGVGDAVTDGRLLAGDLADAGHTNNLKRYQ
jgi:hypothetical protein